MKITFVTDTYSPQANGVATTLQRLVSGLREREHHVDIVRPATLACDEIGMEVPSASLPGYKEVKIGFPSGMLLRRRWSKIRPDVIYVATETPLGASAISTARTLDIPVASGFHTDFPLYMEHYKVPILGQAATRYLRHVHNRSDRTFVPSFDTIEKLQKQGFENLELLPKGVDTKLFSPKRRDSSLRLKWGVPGDAPVGLYVGRIAREKNLPLIIRTFCHLRSRFPDFRGVLVGDGPLLEEYRAAHPEFIFAGVKFGEELAAHYASADLFVFPSTTETFGNVTLEAMASGLSVLAFDYAAARQHIVDGKSGFVVPFGEEDHFVDRAVEALNSPDSFEIRKKARIRARKVRWKKVVKDFEKSLIRMMEGEAVPESETRFTLFRENEFNTREENCKAL